MPPSGSWQPPRERPVLRRLALYAVVGIIFVPFAIILSRLVPVPGVPANLVALVLWIGLGAFGWHMGDVLLAGFMTFMGPLLRPTGETTPYAHDFSPEKAMIARGDAATALALLERHVAANPGDVEARILAADTYAREAHDPRRAAALFREVTRLPAVPAPREVYAANRLADLHDGPLGEPGIALRELARLADRHPGTDVARQARAAIARIKARQEPAAGA